MSVHLTLRKTRDGQEISIPITTQSAFWDFWQPYAKKNSLYYIDIMGDTGFSINSQTLAEFVKELEFMQNDIEKADYFDKKTIDYLKERIYYILSKIKGEVGFADVEGSMA